MPSLVCLATGGDISPAVWVFIGIAAVVVLVILSLVVPALGVWMQALTAGTQVGIVELIGMRLRKTDPRMIVQLLIQARQGGLELHTFQLERHYIAGGHPDDVVRALIVADNTGVELTWMSAAALDLAGRNVLAMVHDAVDTKVIAWPGQAPDETEGNDAPED